MKIAVTGGRDYTNRGLLWAMLNWLHNSKGPIDLVIHGACGWDFGRPDRMLLTLLKGADGLADEWARERSIPIHRLPADWSSHGSKGGHIRNGWILDEKPDLVVAFPGGPGTRNCVSQAFERRIMVVQAPLPDWG